jgi:hypothetical protein
MTSVPSTVPSRPLRVRCSRRQSISSEPAINRPTRNQGSPGAGFARWRRGCSRRRELAQGGRIWPSASRIPATRVGSRPSSASSLWREPCPRMSRIAPLGRSRVSRRRTRSGPGWLPSRQGAHRRGRGVRRLVRLGSRFGRIAGLEVDGQDEGVGLEAQPRRQVGTGGERQGLPAGSVHRCGFPVGLFGMQLQLCSP